MSLCQMLQIIHTQSGRQQIYNRDVDKHFTVAFLSYSFHSGFERQILSSFRAQLSLLDLWASLHYPQCFTLCLGLETSEETEIQLELSVKNEFLIFLFCCFWLQVAVLNGSAEQQLAILQNAEVHGIKFFESFTVIICSVLLYGRRVPRYIFEAESYFQSD